MRDEGQVGGPFWLPTRGTTELGGVGAAAPDAGHLNNGIANHRI